jgi:molybdate transport system substrate-binding protein
VRALTVIATAAVVVLAACGDEEAGAGGELTVSAAASLTEGFEAYAEDTPADERFSFAGSDELAAQIRHGVPVDVFAAANTSLPEELAKEGKLGEPVTFASNQLVLAVPAGGEADSLNALARPGVTLVIGAEGVPVGDYTRAVLARLGAERSEAILANVRSNEPDVKGIVGKLTQGAADAGFVYASDVAAARDELRAIELDPKLEPKASYGAGVVEAAEQPDAAEAFVDDLAAGGCHEALVAAGFGEP